MSGFNITYNPTKYNNSLKFEDVKRAAAGRWREIAMAIGMPPEVLDSRHHFPCPRPGCVDGQGKDRFRAFDDFDETGGVFCNKCHNSRCSDGFNTVAWWLGINNGEALRKVAEIIGMASYSQTPVGPVNRIAPDVAKLRDKFMATLEAACVKHGTPPPTPPPEPRSEPFSTAEKAITSKFPYGTKTRYEYRDATGEVVGYQYRIDLSNGDKRFCPATKDIDGWRPEKGDTQFPLYRLPEISGHEIVYVFEGEKAADAAASIGLAATCSANGAQSPHKADWTPLSGRMVVICPDNDEAGEGYLDAVAGILRELDEPATVRVVRLPGLPDKGDIVDWIELNFGDAATPDVIRGEFLKLVRTGKGDTNSLKGSAMIATYRTRAEPVIEGLFRRGEVANIIAAPKVGKSWLVMNMASCLAQGKPFIGYNVPRKMRVMIADNELHGSEIAFRLRLVKEATGLSDEDLDNIEYKQIRGRGRQDIVTIKNELVAEAVFGEFDVLVLDAFYKFIPPGVSENDNAQMSEVYSVLDDIARRGDCSIVLIHHSSKGDQSEKAVTDVGSGAGSISRAADCHIVLRQHELADCLVMDVEARSSATNARLTVRKDLPLFEPKKEITLIQGEQMAGDFFRVNISHALGAVTAESLSDMGATAAQIAGANFMVITADAATNYLLTSTPTATFGHTLRADVTEEFQKADFGEFNFISQSGTANLTVTLEGYA